MKNTEWLGPDLDKMNRTFDKAFLGGVSNFKWYLIFFILSLPLCSGGVIYFLIGQAK